MTKCPLCGKEIGWELEDGERLCWCGTLDCAITKERVEKKQRELSHG